MKSVLLALLAATTLIISCRDDGWQGGEVTVAREGYVMLRFNADIPAMQEVTTRAVDPDGGGVQDMTLFCFDSYGLFITTVTATISRTDDLNGKFTAEVPENTRTIHFLANQNMNGFPEDKFRNHSESEVMALMEGSSGRMIYWARFACQADNDADIATQMGDPDVFGGTVGIDNVDDGNKTTIKMLRNHALISIANPDYESGASADDESSTENAYIQVTGMAVCNIPAFGTVAPYHSKKGFDFNWKEDKFVTLPANDAKMSDITDVTTETSQYVFESENSADDPVSIIIRGRQVNPDGSEGADLYYRIMLVDETTGEQLLIRRNHHYKLRIVGALSFGQPTFEAALTAAATNNIWISISDEVSEVEDQYYILAVERTAYVIDEEKAGETYDLHYTLRRKDGATITTNDKPKVTWVDNEVAQQNFEETFTVDGNGVGQGTVTIRLHQLGDNEKLEGTLLVKHGQLQRKIEVVLLKRQTFVPSWVGTQVYHESTGSHVTLMFTIPETCSEEMFPMNIYISVNELDIRSASGQPLTVVRKGDSQWYSSGDISDEYGASEPDYKYLFVADGPGVQRVYFENILTQEAGYTGHLYIEAEHFETMHRTFRYTTSQRFITVEGEGLQSYTAFSSDDDDDKDEEVIYYRLVPQKIHANVQFDLRLNDVDEDGSTVYVNADEKDEFLLYSQNLNYYIAETEIKEFDCRFDIYAQKAEEWWRKYNPEGGRMLMFKPDKDKREKTGDDEGKYSIYMYTNRAVSEEVVRIASNLHESQAISTSDPDDTEDVEGSNLYGGYGYRSITFELANYTPFRFGARVRLLDEDVWQGEADEPDRSHTVDEVPETVTPITWTYQPDRKVDIAFDVTSFHGSDNKSVDPFGEAFEIYIDAPMLSIDAGRLAAYNLDNTKLKPDPSVSGRFIYTVDAERETEQAYGAPDAEVVNKDAAPDDSEAAYSPPSQTGERKILPFTISTPVSAGDIVISSNKKQVVFYDKTFRVTNSPITGTLKYQTAADEQPQDVPQSAFVSFERAVNDSRIGAVTVTADGQYELRLRKEYTFNWYADKIVIEYITDKGVSCQAEYGSLAELFANPNIVLRAATTP